jgi:glycosyltransferase involved in cell wall biosynthesis
VKKVFLGAPLDEFQPFSPEQAREARHRLGFDDDAVKLFGTVTRLHESKGNRYFVEAAARVAKQLPGARFVVVGEGPLQPELEAQADALGVRDRFFFLGFQRDVAACFASFDVAVFPSLWEGTPLTVFECMAMRRPILSTDVDGLREVLVNDVNAVVVQPRDANALADEMLRLIGDDALRERLATSAYETSTRFGIQAFVDTMERLYGVLVERYRDEGRRPRWNYEKDFDFLPAGS